MNIETKRRSSKALDTLLLSYILRLTLPMAVIKKCVQVEDESTRDRAIDDISQFYFDLPKIKGYQNGHRIRQTNIKKIIDEFLDKGSSGIKFEDKPDAILDVVLDHADNQEMLGLVLWIIWKKGLKEKKYKDLLLYFIIDGYLTSALSHKIAELRPLANRFEAAQGKFDKQRKETEQKREEVTDLKRVVENLKREIVQISNEKKTVPIETVKTSRIKIENRELQLRIQTITRKLEDLTNAQQDAEKSDQRTGDLNARINRARASLPEALDAIARAKGKLKSVRADIIGLNKAITVREEVVRQVDKPILDFFIDSYDLRMNTAPERFIDFALLKEWARSFFPKQDLNSITLFVRLSDKKGSLIRNAKSAGFNVEFLPSHSWVSSLSCRLMESQADCICLVASNPQFSALSRAFNRRNKKFFFAFPKEKMPEDLHEVDFIPMEEKNYTQRRISYG